MFASASAAMLLRKWLVTPPLINQWPALQYGQSWPSTHLYPSLLLVHLSLDLHLAALLVHTKSFLLAFPCCIFLRSFQFSQDVLVSPFSSLGPKRLLGIYVFFLWIIFCMCQILVTPFCSKQSMRIVAFSVGTTFLLPVSFIALLKLDIKIKKAVKQR